MKKVKSILIAQSIYALNIIDDVLLYVENGFYGLLWILVIVLSAGVIFSSYLYFKSPATLPYVFLNVVKSTDSSPPLNVLGASVVRERPLVVNNLQAPYITAKSALVVDLDSGKFLYNLHDDEQLAPASTTKLLTALVALDLYKPDEIISVPEFCTTIDSTRAGLLAGQKYTVKDLIYSMLIGSAGDSACTLSTSKAVYADFVSKMNDKAEKLGMASSHFSNPVGLDGVNGDQISTADDLYKLSSEIMKNDFIKSIVRTTDFTFSAVAEKDLPDSEIHLVNTNKLLATIPNTIGVKTGTTTEAGEVLIYAYKDDEKSLMIIVMGSTDRFTDTTNLLNWILQKYSWK